jgi:hypothetical protein
MKGVDSVDQTDEINSNWKVKVFKSRRTWKATVTEQIPDRKIAWSTDGPKGSTKGVVTFHPLSDDLTQVLLVMEYYPQGLFEKTGNIWRAQGRRARLDLKNFRRFITMRGEETGSWRGEIRDSEVVRGPDEEEESEDRSPTSGGDEEELDERAESDDLEEDEPDEGDEAEDEDDEEDEGDEDQYDEDEYEEDEGEDDEGEDDEDAEDYEDEDQYDDEDADQDEPDEEQEAPRGNGRPRRREPAGAGRR